MVRSPFFVTDAIPWANCESILFHLLAVQCLDHLFYVLAGIFHLLVLLSFLKTISIARKCGFWTWQLWGRRFGLDTTLEYTHFTVFFNICACISVALLQHDSMSCLQSITAERVNQIVTNRGYFSGTGMVLTSRNRVLQPTLSVGKRCWQKRELCCKQKLSYSAFPEIWDK